MRTVSILPFALAALAAAANAAKELPFHAVENFALTYRSHAKRDLPSHIQPYPNEIRVTFDAMGRTTNETLRRFNVVDDKYRLFVDDDEVNSGALATTYHAFLGDGWISATIYPDGLLHALVNKDGLLIQVDPKYIHEEAIAHSKRDLYGEMVAFYPDEHNQDATCGTDDRHDFSHTHQFPPVSEIIKAQSIENFINNSTTKSSTLQKRAAPGPGGYPTRWTSCYPGDTVTHSIGIAFVTDMGFSSIFSFSTSSVQAYVASIVSDANMIYYYQLNIVVKMANLIVKTAASSDTWNQDNEGISTTTRCDSTYSIDTMLTDFTSYRDGLTDTTLTAIPQWFLLTNCYPAPGTVGLAYVGVLCSLSSNTGVVSYSTATWKTFAHELGHNFGALHTFQNGQGTTGSIMDYADGTLDGIYQFYTLYSQGQICTELTNTFSTNDTKFTPCVVTYTSTCGNGILEYGEECDSTSSYCSSCQLVYPAQCDPSTAGVVCCLSNGQFSPSTTSCNDAAGVAGFCANGTCNTGSWCATYSNLAFCGTATSGTYAGCQPTCMDTTSGSTTCYSPSSFSASGSATYYNNGTVCGTNMECQNGICVAVASAPSVAPAASPSSTPSPSSTRSPTPTPSGTPTPSPTTTPSRSPTPTSTPTPTTTPSASPSTTTTPSPSGTPTTTPSLSSTPSASVTPTTTPSASVSLSASPSVSVSSSVAPSVVANAPTPSPSTTVSPSTSPSLSATPTSSPSSSATPSTTPSGSATPTPSPTATASLTPSPSTSASSTPSNTPSPSTSSTPSLSASPSVSSSPSTTPSSSPSPSTTPSASSSPSHTPSPSASISPIPSTTASFAWKIDSAFGQCVPTDPRGCGDGIATRSVNCYNGANITSSVYCTYLNLTEPATQENCTSAVSCSIYTYQWVATYDTPCYNTSATCGTTGLQNATISCLQSTTDNSKLPVSVAASYCDQYAAANSKPSAQQTCTLNACPSPGALPLYLCTAWDDCESTQCDPTTLLWTNASQSRTCSCSASNGMCQFSDGTTALTASQLTRSCSLNNYCGPLWAIAAEAAYRQSSCQANCVSYANYTCQHFDSRGGYLGRLPDSDCSSLPTPPTLTLRCVGGSCVQSNFVVLNITWQDSADFGPCLGKYCNNLTQTRSFECWNITEGYEARVDDSVCNNLNVPKKAPVVQACLSSTCTQPTFVSPGSGSLPPDQVSTTNTALIIGVSVGGAALVALAAAGTIYALRARAFAAKEAGGRDKYKVITPYKTTQADEIELREGDIVVVRESFGEWATGYNERTRRTGRFPMSNVMPADTSRMILVARPETVYNRMSRMFGRNRGNSSASAAVNMGATASNPAFAMDGLSAPAPALPRSAPPGPFARR